MGSLSFREVPIEQVEEFWDRRPCNIRHSPLPVGTREYFDQVEARRYFVEPHNFRFAEFPRWSGKKVLEIGCGIGTDTIGFAREGAHVTAVELSEESLKIAHQRAFVYGLADRIRFYRGNAEELTRFVPEEPYDLVYAFGVIHHTPHPERVLEQIRHYVQFGSVLKLMVYHRHSWKAFYNILAYGKGRFWRSWEWVARYSEAQVGCPVVYTYSRREIQRLFEQNGFRMVDLAVEFIFPYRIGDYIHHRYVKTWYFRWMPVGMFRWLERRFGWHLCVTAQVQC